MSKDYSKIRILIVDDMAVMRKLVTGVIKKIGFVKIESAENGVLAKRKIEKSIEEKDVFEFIISDWTMPEMTGIELLQFVRGNDAYKNTPFLMLTAEGEKQNIVKAIDAGVSGYILKPFTEEKMREKIQEILK